MKQCVYPAHELLRALAGRHAGQERRRTSRCELDVRDEQVERLRLALRDRGCGGGGAVAGCVGGEEDFAAHAAHDRCVADADNGAAAGVGEGAGVDVWLAGLGGRAGVGAEGGGRG